jgi:hypothetical protein
MRFKMVHRNEWDIPHERKSLCCAHSDEKRADETGANCCSNCVNVIILNARFDERTRNDRREKFDMRATSNFRNNAAVAGMQVNLA